MNSCISKLFGLSIIAIFVLKNNLENLEFSENEIPWVFPEFGKIFIFPDWKIHNPFSRFSRSGGHPAG